MYFQQIESQREVEKYFQKGDFDKVSKILSNFSMKNEFFYTASANYYYSLEEIDKGIEVLEKSLSHFSNSFEVYFNLATLLSIKEEYKKSILAYARAIKLASTDEDKNEALSKVNDLLQVLQSDVSNSKVELQEIAHQAQQIIQEFDDRIYPLNRYGESLIRKVHNGNELTNLYRAMGAEDIDVNSRFHFKAELFRGVATKEITLAIDNPSVLPLSFIEGVSQITITTPTKELQFKMGTLDKNHYNYLRLEEAGSYTIKADTEIFVGNPLSLRDDVKKNTPKLVVSLFIDGLSGKFLEEHIDDYMPRTAAFFKDGYINTNCYTTGDWTYPSVSSLLTGKTTLTHGRHHPTNYFDFTKYNRIFFNDIKEAGYTTAQFNNNWRMTPTYGYSEGMDRTVYQNFLGGFAAGEVISEAIEHIETFKETPQYVWLSLTDLHDVADEINDNFLSQVDSPMWSRTDKKLGATSVQSKYDENKIERYKHEMKRLDLHLSALYNYLLANYHTEDILITLFSDHGQTYFSQEEFLLHEYRTKIPFMMVGNNIKAKKSDELSSIIDIFPTMMSQLNITADVHEGKVLQSFDGEGREFTITETIHPDQPYLAVIKTENNEYRFKTVDKVDGNCRVNLETYEYNALEDKTPEEMDNYLGYILKRAAVLQR